MTGIKVKRFCFFVNFSKVFVIKWVSLATNEKTSRLAGGISDLIFCLDRVGL